MCREQSACMAGLVGVEDCISSAASERDQRNTWINGCNLLADSVQEATALFKGNVYLAKEEK